MADIIELVRDNKRAIILIDTVIPDGINQNKVSIKGTGFIVSPDGKFITNAHVYKQIEKDEWEYAGVSIPGIPDGRGLITYDRFKIEKIDVDEENDIALMRIVSERNDFPIVHGLEGGEMIREGERVIFIGYPLAVELLNMGFGITMTTNGALASSIKRRGNDASFHFFLIDSHINNGSSGSPVFSVETGKVVGVASAKISAKVQIPNGPIADIPANMGICRPIQYATELINKNKK